VKTALNEFQIEGIKTNKDFLLKILENNTFNEGKFDTSFVEKFVTNKL
jgi:acetyl-CoA carboxylase biotin carboxylase subunit